MDTTSRRTRVLPIVVVLATFGTAACSGSDIEVGDPTTTSGPMRTALPDTTATPATTDTPATTQAPATTDAPATSPPTGRPIEGIPQGDYRATSVTREQIIATTAAAGLMPEAGIAALLDEVGLQISAATRLRLADGRWTSYVSIDGQPEEVRFRGTYEVVDDDTVVYTDHCGEVTYRYTFTGDDLTLDIVDDQCAVIDPPAGVEQQLNFEFAPFIRVAAAPEPTAEAAYSSTSFVVPFDVTLPAWLAPTPAVEDPNFVTWEGAAVDRAIRILVPVAVYPPGSDTTTPPPADYLDYLLAQSAHGAVFNDITQTTVDGHPATIVTATIPGPDGLHGSIGCPAEGLGSHDCLGIQPDVVLRIAVIDAEPGPLLIWIRDPRGASDREFEYLTFDAMLASLHFGRQ